MRNEITVMEVKQRRKELEEILLARIKSFELETGCSVKALDLCHNQTTDGLSEVYALFVECGL